MKKRLLSLLLCAIMLLSLLPTATFADSGKLVMRLAVSSVNGESAVTEVKAGDTITVDLIIDENPNLGGLALQFLTKGALTLQKIEAVSGTPFASNFAATNETKTITWYVNEDIYATGPAMRLTFKVDESATGELSIDARPDEDLEDNISHYTDASLGEIEPVPYTITPCTITVAGGGENPNVPVTGVKLDKTTLELTEGQEEQLTATVDPETATTRTVKWTSNSEQVTVDENGKVKALNYTAGSTGKATITVTTDDGAYTATCEVTVKHGNLQKVGEQPASCTKEGHQAYWFCDTCKHYYTDVNGAPGEETTEEALKTDALGHDMTQVPGTPASCTKGGNNGYFVCNRCNGVFKDVKGTEPTTAEGEAIGPLGHAWNETYNYSATHHWIECGRCGDPKEGTSEEHTLVVVKKTYADGSTTHEVKCSVCDYTTERAHELDEGDVSDTWKHDKDNHWHVYGCGTIMNKESHTWDTGKVTKAATCTEKGETTYTCKVCDRTKTEEDIPAKGHQKVLNKTDAIPATCTTGGNDAYWTCPDCGTYFSDEGGQNVIEKDSWIKEKLGHDFGGEWFNGGDGHYQLCQRAGCGAKSDLKPHRFDPKAPCDETASCLDGCGYVRPAGTHTWGKPEYKWTETEDSYTCTGTVVCDTCGDNEHGTATVTDAVTTQSTCTQPGVKTFTATFIKAPFETQTTTEPVTTLAPHTMVKTEDKAATCVAAGNNAYWTCSVCKGVFKDELGKTATTVEAETLPIDPANHTGNTELRDAVTATCNMSGHEADTYCKDCGVLLSRGATIPATGKHTYGEDGRCTSCGNVNPTAGVNTDDIKAADTVNGTPVSPDNSGKVIASNDGKTVIRTPAAADDNTVQQVKDALTGGSVTLYVDNRETEALTGSDGGVAALEALAASASGERKQELEKLAEALKALLNDSGRKNAAGQMVYDGEMQLCDANGVPVAELVQSPNSIQVTLPITEAQYQAMQGKKVCVLRSSTDASGAAAVTELSATVGGSQGARVLSFSTDKGGALALAVYETVSSGGSSGGSGSSTAPRTADAGVTVWCALLGISALLGTALVAKKRRQA